MAPPAGQEQGRKRITPAHVREARLGWFLVLPAVIIVVGMIGYPFVEAIRISFTDNAHNSRHADFVC